MNYRYLIKNIIGFMTKPRWYFLFMIIPMASLSFAYIQTIYFNIALNKLNMNQFNDYYSSVISQPHFDYYFVSLLIFLFFPYLILHLLHGLGTISRSKTKKNLIKYFKTKISEIRKDLFAIIIALTLIGIYRQSFKVSTFLEEVLVIIITILIISLVILLTSRFSGGDDYKAIGSTIIALCTSIIVVVIVAFLTKSTIKGFYLNPIIYHGLWQNLIIILVIYMLLCIYTMWIGMRFSYVNHSFINTTVFHYVISIIFSFFFIFLALLIIFTEFWHIETELFKGRIKQIFKDRPYNLVFIKNFFDNFIWWRSVYSLLIGVVISSVLVSILKVAAYYASTNKNTEKKMA